ncbi:MAG: FG-GAP repeat protein [Dokdonella sp.]|uniref:FG-GAP repeat protein n=1 Tax=Dokdonella sp. TaxID=2291710 RepID=UPI003267E8FF
MNPILSTFSLTRSRVAVRAPVPRALACLLAIACAPWAGAAIPLSAVGNVALPNPGAISPENDAFGSSVAVGDFNDDGIDDLAVADREHPNLVRVFFGTAWTVGQPVSLPFVMETITVPAVPGTTLGPPVVLAAGDFGHDASDDDDLVVGVPGDSLSADNAGAVFVFDRASGGGWSLIDTIRQGYDGYPGISEAGDHFGAALAVGRFDQNDLVDLAIGVPGETTSGQANAGTAYIVYQGVGGLYPESVEGFYRGYNGLTGVPTANEQIGFALAAGDFNGDGIEDLAVGIPGTTCAGFVNAGSVMVLSGRDDLEGLDAAGVSYWNQTHAGVADDCEANDRFGSAIVAGRFKQTPLGDPETIDLAIGAPGEALDGISLAGAVNVLFGGPGGITAEDDLFLHESMFPGGSTASVAFGARLASGRINEGAGTRDSLLVASPFASEGGVSAAGRIWVIPSSGGELAPERAESRRLTPQYAAWPAGTADGLGSQLAVGDFNGDSDNDIAIGIPGSDATATGAGIVQVIYQSSFIFVDGFD